MFQRSAGREFAGSSATLFFVLAVEARMRVRLPARPVDASQCQAAGVSVVSGSFWQSCLNSVMWWRFVPMTTSAHRRFYSVQPCFALHRLERCTEHCAAQQYHARFDWLTALPGPQLVSLV